MTQTKINCWDPQLGVSAWLELENVPGDVPTVYLHVSDGAGGQSKLYLTQQHARELRLALEMHINLMPMARPKQPAT